MALERIGTHLQPLLQDFAGNSDHSAQHGAHATGQGLHLQLSCAACQGFQACEAPLKRKCPQAMADKLPRDRWKHSPASIPCSLAVWFLRRWQAFNLDDPCRQILQEGYPSDPEGVRIHRSLRA